MIDWLLNLPVAWMTLVVFGGTYLAAGVIYWIVMALAVGERARAFKGISPGMLPPLGIIFGLFVAFVAAQVWSDVEHAKTAVNREASALRAVILLTANFPGEPETRLHALVRRYITESVTQEWPMMAQHRATLTLAPPALTEALQLTLALTPRGEGQAAAQREMAASLQNALDARRQRIMISQSGVNWVKWTGRPRALRDGRGRLPGVDRLPQSAVHGGGLRRTGGAAASDAGRGHVGLKSLRASPEKILRVEPFSADI